MLQCHDNLMKIGSTMSDTRFNIIIMSSLPESYQPTLQMLTATERVNKLSGLQANAMKADDMIAFIIEEAQHWVINNDQTKTAESALAACMKKTSKPKGRKKDKSKSNMTCKNCNRPGHSKDDCWSKGGEKEGQGPRQKKKGKTTKTVVVAADDDDNELFAFICTSNHAAVADMLDIPKSRLGTCMDSRASRHYCPEHSKFTNYKPIEQKITTADGSTFMTTGMGDLHIGLPNGSGKSKPYSKMLYTHLIWPLPSSLLANSTRLDSPSCSTRACAPSGTMPERRLPPFQVAMDFTK